MDGAFTGGALAVGGVGTLVRRAQNGFVRSYALSLLAAYSSSCSRCWR